MNNALVALRVICLARILAALARFLASAPDLRAQACGSNAREGRRFVRLRWEQITRHGKCFSSVLAVYKILQLSVFLWVKAPSSLLLLLLLEFSVIVMHSAWHYSSAKFLSDKNSIFVNIEYNELVFSYKYVPHKI